MARPKKYDIDTEEIRKLAKYGMTNVETDYDGSGISNWLIDQFQDGILYYNYRGIYIFSRTNKNMYK